METAPRTGNLRRQRIHQAVVIGLCVALKWIYDRIERHAQRTVRQAQFVVLDVQASWREAGAMTAVPHVD